MLGGRSEVPWGLKAHTVTCRSESSLLVEKISGFVNYAPFCLILLLYFSLWKAALFPLSKDDQYSQIRAVQKEC